MENSGRPGSKKRAIVRILFFAALTFLITWSTGMVVVLSAHAESVNRAHRIHQPIPLSFPIVTLFVVIPLRFTAAVTWCLLRCHRWLDEEHGYTDLINLITSDRDVYQEADALVWPLYEALRFDPSSEVIDLRYEWAACMGIPPEV